MMFSLWGKEYFNKLPVSASSLYSKIYLTLLEFI